jgi:hypothetical protein
VDSDPEEAQMVREKTGFTVKTATALIMLVLAGCTHGPAAIRKNPSHMVWMGQTASIDATVGPSIILWV